MLDTGAGKNVIKENCVFPYSEIFKEKIIRFSRITEGIVYSLGFIVVRVLGKDEIFHVVPDDFSIVQS